MGVLNCPAQEILHTPPRPIGDEFDPRYDPSPWMRLPFALSHDGRLAAVALATGGVRLIPLDGSTARDLAGAGPKSRPIQWAPDGSKPYVLDATEIPAHVLLVDVATGQRQAVLEIHPRDSSGVYVIENVALTPDSTAYAYHYQQFQSGLYVVDGLR